ncbi:MAG: cell wall-binding repeat-containing protein [Desulfitobacteriaceae bacterium]
MNKRYFRMSSILYLISAFLIIQPVLLLAAQPANHLERIYGGSRYQTMLQIALKFQPGTAQNVVLATGNDFSDALAGVPLAHQKGGPLLLVDSTPELSQEAFSYIKNHLVKSGNIYILGGSAAIPDSFITALNQLGFPSSAIHRLSGSDRYQTAVAIAQELQHNGSEFYVVRGDDFPDALCATVLAATTGYVSPEKANYFKKKGQNLSVSQGGIPLILVPSQGPVPVSVIDYLNSIPDSTNTLKQTFHIVGGSTAISEESLQQLKSQVKRIIPDNLTRISGDTCYGTMNRIDSNESSFDSSWLNNGSSIPIPHIYVASGENFPDGLAGAVLAAKDQAPLVLVNNSLPEETVALLRGYWGRNQKGVAQGTTITVFGGSTILSGKTINAVDYIFNFGQSVTDKPLVENLAGSGKFGYLDARNQEAEFTLPSGIAGTKDGTVYVSDTQNQRIRAILPGGSVITVAGTSNGKDNYGRLIGGFQDGEAMKAMFNQPKGLAVDEEGNIYVADSGNGAIRLIDKSGQVKTLIKGLNYPSDIVLGKDGEFYVSETLNHRVLRLLKNGTSTVLAGGGYVMKDNWLKGGYADGQGIMAQFNEPSGLALGPNGSLYVADSGNQRIRVISMLGEVATLAGSADPLINNADYLAVGFQDGPGSTAKFAFPSGLTVAADGTVYVADTYNHRIREITKEGMVKTLAGTGVHGKQNGFLELTQFDCPYAVKLNKDGNLLIIDQFNNSVSILKWHP